MFAYVRYIDDGLKEIVPATFIKDFQKPFDLTPTYWIRWEEEYFKGQVLILKGNVSCYESSTRRLVSVFLLLLLVSTHLLSKFKRLVL